MYDIGILAQDIPIPVVPRLVLPLGYALLFFRFGQVLARRSGYRAACSSTRQRRRSAPARRPGDAPKGRE